MAQPGFIFGENAPDTYESLQAKRKTAERLGLAAMRTPQNLGEGLTSLGHAIAYRRMMGQADRGEAAGKAAYDEKRQSILGMLMGNQLGAGAASYPAGPGITPPDPSSPDAIGANAMAAIGKASFEPGDRDSFTSAMWPHALRVAEKTGLDPRLVVAQAAQETGWGKSAPGNNFFGVKSHGKPGGNNFATNEVIGGETVRINDSFRGYGSMGQSADDYAQFLLDNPRYKEMLSAPDLEGQVAALGRSGYATDPNYAASVGSIAGGIPGGSPMSTPGAAIPGITELMSDPYATEADKTVLGMLLQQQMTAMQPPDPMQALDMEYKRAQIDEMRNGGAQDLPEGYEGKHMTALAGGLLPGTPEYQAFMLGSTEGEEFGTSIVWGRDEAGKIVPAQVSKNGSIRLSDVPEGWTADPGLNAQAQAEGRAIGTATGEAKIGLDGALLKTKQALDLIDAISTDPALESVTGTFQGGLFAPGIPMITGGQAGTDLVAKTEQLKGKVFVEAFESLKGAGQITETEGAAATAAIGRLNRAQSTPAYQAALAELKTALQDLSKIAQGRAGVTAPSSSPQATHRFNPATGKIEAVQ